MALTEPEAGSSLADITTMAEPTADGYYRIKGQKIFISAGDHDGVDNVVHLMLAKIKGAPAGVKGISLLQDVTAHLISIARQEGPEAFLADATLYLEFFGHVTIAWQWLLQGIAVQKALDNGAAKKDFNFYHGKMFTLRYFFAYELPKTLGLAERLMDDDRLTLEMQTDYFND